MGNEHRPVKERVRTFLKAASRFKGLWQYLLFVLVAGLFWFIMALNDEVQSDFSVRVEITDVPDSVTFITDPPKTFNITVRDKGTSLFRRRFMETPVIKIPFAEYVSGHRLRVSSSAIMGRLRGVFGTGASISITSTDSIGVDFTTSRGKVVPIRVDADVTAALGKVINGEPQLSVREARIFSVSDIIDTVMYVRTMPIVRRNISDPLRLRVEIRPIRGVRIEPSSVEVTIPVEPLENRKMFVPITPIGVPPGESMALFPQKLEVSYLVPMSEREDIQPTGFKVVADYTDIAEGSSAMVRVKIASKPATVVNASLPVDSVEYTLIRELR